MRVIRFNMALGLLLTAVLLMPAQFVLLTYPLLTYPAVAGTGLTSLPTQATRSAPCHDESAPTDQTPKNHDCCVVGHLHAMGYAQASIAPAFEVTSVNRTAVRSATNEVTASYTGVFLDTGPPGSAVPIRI
jgi:hypothetical protein